MISENETVLKKVKKTKGCYKAAAYLRLSREDGAVKSAAGPEGGSIRSQRELIQSYVRDRDDMEIYDFYVDDGWSGVNFERPSFQRMMGDIEDGHVNCVIVKDLSRLGRDYIEAGRLVQKTFPAFSVRFIAINDNFDSMTADYNDIFFMLPIRNFVNDSYCRDISWKVRSHQKIKRELGDFIGAFAVYGYKKDIRNHNHLVVDTYAAGIVKKIFAWKMAGASNSRIAGRLNEMGILSPMEYKKSQGERFFSGFSAGKKAEWSSVAVKRILNNEIYTGVMVQGKSEKINYKVKRCVPKPKEEWVRVKGTHEAIIPAVDFRIVQRLMEVNSRASAGKEHCHIFSGFLFCRDCQKPMIRRVSRCDGGERVTYICQTKNRGDGCSRHAISEDVLKQLVMTALRRQLDLFAGKNYIRAYREAVTYFGEGIDIFERETERLREGQKEYTALRAGLYEDWKRGMISEKEFLEFGDIFEKQHHELQNIIRQQERAKEKMQEAEEGMKKRVGQGVSGQEFSELTREILLSFISRILIYEDKRIYVEFLAKDMSGERG